MFKSLLYLALLAFISIGCVNTKTSVNKLNIKDMESNSAESTAYRYMNFYEKNDFKNALKYENTDAKAISALYVKEIIISEIKIDQLKLTRKLFDKNITVEHINSLSADEILNIFTKILVKQKKMHVEFKDTIIKNNSLSIVPLKINTYMLESNTISKNNDKSHKPRIFHNVNGEIYLRKVNNSWTIDEKSGLPITITKRIKKYIMMHHAKKFNELRLKMMRGEIHEILSRPKSTNDICLKGIHDSLLNTVNTDPDTKNLDKKKKEEILEGMMKKIGPNPCFLWNAMKKI